MTLIPLAIDDATMDVIVILRPNNIARILAHDPAELVHRNMGKWSDRAIRNVVITYASDADMATIMPMIENGELQQAIRFLCRGWKHRPDAGDHDGPCESLRYLN